MTPPSPSRSLIIVDDDLLSREILSLLSVQAGFQVQAFASGELALESLATPNAPIPHAILADMQMPGICGDSLARLLRAGCGPSTTLLAMSGTAVPSSHTRSFDAFLLKPFSIDELCAAIDRSRPGPALTCAPAATVLDQAIYESFARSMSHAQVRRLYAMCLDDAEARIASLRNVSAARDLDTFRSIAHAIKGGCGMLGALELAELAQRLEAHGPEALEHADPFAAMLAACARLRHLLDAQEANLAADVTECGELANA